MQEHVSWSSRVVGALDIGAGATTQSVDLDDLGSLYIIGKESLGVIG